MPGLCQISIHAPFAAAMLTRTANGALLKPVENRTSRTQLFPVATHLPSRWLKGRWLAVQVTHSWPKTYGGKRPDLDIRNAWWDQLRDCERTQETMQRLTPGCICFVAHFCRSTTRRQIQTELEHAELLGDQIEAEFLNRVLRWACPEEQTKYDTLWVADDVRELPVHLGTQGFQAPIVTIPCPHAHLACALTAAGASEEQIRSACWRACSAAGGQ